MFQRPVQLILDFDGTLTKKDTLHLVAKVGYQRQQKAPESTQPPPWQNMVDAYISDYEAYSSRYKPAKSERKTVSEEFTWLDSLKSIERASADRVVKAGIFNSVTRYDMEEAAKRALEDHEVELRAGWAELLTMVHNHNSKSDPEASVSPLLQIVSVNWSRWFVWCIMWKAANSLSDPTVSDCVADSLKATAVFANEVDSVITSTGQPTSSMPCPGGEPMTLRTAGDKLRQMQSTKPQLNLQSDPLRVYIGDSTTDLECLITADVGISVRDQDVSSGQKDLSSTCDRLGLVLRPLEEYQEIRKPTSSLQTSQEKSLNDLSPIYYAYDFHEVTRWLSGILSNPS